MTVKPAVLTPRFFSASPGIALPVRDAMQWGLINRCRSPKLRHLPQRRYGLANAVALAKMERGSLSQFFTSHVSL